MGSAIIVMPTNATNMILLLYLMVGDGEKNVHIVMVFIL